MMTNIFPVILCGGAGTRLWPLSRQDFPKQFHAIASDEAMIVETAKRFQADIFQKLTVISANKYRFLVAQTLQDSGFDDCDIILEPVARNTAMAVCVSALHIVSKDANGLVLIAPSDHIIKKNSVFQTAIRNASCAAEDGLIATFGIVPEYPETAYGYIKQNDPLKSNAALFEIDRFVEKPDLVTAKEMLGEGGYLWNSGIFLFKANIVLEEFKRHSPDVYKAAKESYDKAYRDHDFVRLDDDAFEKAPSLAFDVAVMEKTEHGCVVPVEMGWSDVGAWPAVHDQLPHDLFGNATVGDTELVETSNSMVWSQDDIRTSVIGMDDVLVISTQDNVLVTNKNNATKIGDFAKYIQARSAPETGRLPAAKFYRPWGYYQTVDQGKGFQVKRLVIRPKARLSLQYHNHRSEHWVVVEGCATVTCDDKGFELNVNESTYIPVGSSHRLENKSENILVLIEVQSGSVLSEEDIVRLDDDWGRSEKNEGKQV